MSKAAVPAILTSDSRPDPWDAAAFQAASGVSRETLAQLEEFARLLTQWQKRVPLVGAATLPDLWHRHMLDSAQLLPLAPPEAKFWVDVGAGGGFPGMVLAILLHSRPGVVVHLVEAHQRKAAFLQEVADKLKVPAQVHPHRLEDIASELAPADVITVRACAPLNTLLPLIKPLFGPKTHALLCTGARGEQQLAQIRQKWALTMQKHPSQTNPAATILQVTKLTPIRATSRKTPHPRP